MHFEIKVPDDNPDTFIVSLGRTNLAESCWKSLEDSAPQGYRLIAFSAKSGAINVMYKRVKE